MGGLTGLEIPSRPQIGAKQTRLNGQSLTPDDLANWPGIAKRIYKVEVKLLFSGTHTVFKSGNVLDLF